MMWAARVFTGIFPVPIGCGRAGVFMLAWLLGGAGFAAGPAASTVPADDRVVELPPLLVSERLDWRYVEAPGMAVLSLCPDDITCELVQGVHRLRQLLPLILPAEFQNRMTAPAELILFDHSDRLMMSKEVMADLLRRSRGSVDAAGRARLLPTAVQVLPNLRLDDTDVTATFALLGPETDRDTLRLTKDHMRFLLQSRTPMLPGWYLEGMMIIFDRTVFEAEAVRIEPLPQVELPAADPAKPPALLPLPALFAWRNLPGEVSRRAVVAQSALFIRWGLDPAQGPGAERFWRLVDRLTGRPFAEPMIEECLGMTTAEAQQRLMRYAPVATAEPLRLEGGNITALRGLKPREATKAEIGWLKGDWERLAVAHVSRSHPELVENYRAQARRTFRRAYETGARDPRFLAAYGITECDAGDPDGRALGLLEPAAAARVPRPRAYVELARLRLAATTGKLDAGQLASVLEPLFAARAQLPPQLDVFLLGAEAWSRAAVTPAAKHLALLNEGLALFPLSGELLWRSANVYAQFGYRTEAMSLAQLGCQVARNETMRGRFAQLRDRLAAAK